mgnify:CR=1 FL=1
MTAPTVAVTAKLSSFGGPALAGVVITATADKDDNYQGLILRKTVTATTDTNGEAVFNLFPNALATAALPGLGTTGSTYRFTASVPNGWRMDVSAQVPNVACDLHSIVMADDAELPTPGEVAGAVRYDIAQTLTSPQQAQARANIGFDAAVRAVALTGLSLATATAVTAADSVLVAFGKAQAQITALDTAKANLSGAAFTGAVSATGFTGPLTGNVTGNVSGSAGSVAASAITGTTLAANVVTSSLTAVGTIATGVWQGTAIADTYLATISTGGKVANSATTATSANTASAIVARDASGNFTAGTITAALSGNASTATTLATARNINGVAFNGSADITVTAAAGTLTGTTLAANVVNASLNSITPTGGLLAVTGSFTASGNASFQANAIAQAGLRITGAAPLNANDGRLFAYEAPITKFYIGDGTGYSFAFGKRAGGVSTDLVTITDTGAVTINNNLTVAGVAVTGNVSATGSLQAGAVSATKLSVGDDATYDLNIKNAGSSGASAIGNLLAGNAGTSALFFSDTDANGKGRVQYEHATDTLKLFAGSAARFTQTDSLTTIDNPTSITSTLVVNHATASNNNAELVNTAATGYGLFSRGGGGANYAALFLDYSAGNVLGTLSGVGDWTVAGTASFAATNCRIASNGNVTNLNGVYGTISDAKLKRDWTPTSPKLQKILAMQIVDYYLRADQTNTKLLGMIAQDLRRISPGLVEETPDYEDVIVEPAQTETVTRQGYTAYVQVPPRVERRPLGTVTLSIKYSVLVPMLVKGLQELHADFDGRLKALEAS